MQGSLVEHLGKLVVGLHDGLTYVYIYMYIYIYICIYIHMYIYIFLRDGMQVLRYVQRILVRLQLKWAQNEIIITNTCTWIYLLG